MMNNKLIHHGKEIIFCIFDFFKSQISFRRLRYQSGHLAYYHNSLIPIAMVKFNLNTIYRTHFIDNCPGQLSRAQIQNLINYTKRHVSYAKTLCIVPLLKSTYVALIFQCSCDLPSMRFTFKKSEKSLNFIFFVKIFFIFFLNFVIQLISYVSGFHLLNRNA